MFVKPLKVIERGWCEKRLKTIEGNFDNNIKNMNHHDCNPFCSTNPLIASARKIYRNQQKILIL